MYGTFVFRNLTLLCIVVFFKVGHSPIAASSEDMASKPYYGPDEPASTIFMERTFLAGCFLSGMTYGIQLAVYTPCAIFLWNVRRSRGYQSVFLLAYMTLLLCLETIFQAVQTRGVQVNYVDNRNYPGGPWAFFLANQNLPVNVIYYATLFVMIFLGDLLVLWRCWVIWNASGKWIAYAVVIFPALMIVASFVMGTLWTLQSSQPGLSLYSKLPMAYGITCYAISLGVNILLTILITTRILLHRRRIIAALPLEHGKDYFSLATIMIESAALYSVFALLFTITYILDSPINQLFIGVTSSMQQIASYLIIYRLANGRAWNQGTVAEQEKLQTLRFVGVQQIETYDLGTPTDATPESPFSKNSMNLKYWGSSSTSALPKSPY